MDHDDATVAIAAFARDLSVLLARLADQLSSPRSAEAPVRSIYGPTTMDLPWKERVLRQSLILHEIVAAGGAVEYEAWKQIAGKYGYAGRGLAGFFRSNGQGLLDVHKNGRVRVTKHGRERLSQNANRVMAALAEQEVFPTAV